MADFTKVQQALERRGYTVRTFATAAEAAAYLDGAIDGTDRGLRRLRHPGRSGGVRPAGGPQHRHLALEAGRRTPPGRRPCRPRCTCTSANGLAETGEIVNIDGTGNRVSATLFGHEKVYFVIGRNKLAPTYEAAVWRARNVAAPQRAQQLGKKTPCAVKADRCYDCKSPERVCRGLVTLWGPMLGMETEVLLVDEDLGL